MPALRLEDDVETAAGAIFRSDDASMGDEFDARMRAQCSAQMIRDRPRVDRDLACLVGGLDDCGIISRRKLFPGEAAPHRTRCVERADHRPPWQDFVERLKNP